MEDGWTKDQKQKVMYIRYVTGNWYSKLLCIICFNINRYLEDIKGILYKRERNGSVVNETNQIEAKEIFTALYVLISVCLSGIYFWFFTVQFSLYYPFLLLLVFTDLKENNI